MSEAVPSNNQKMPGMVTAFRDWMAKKLGVGSRRKGELYLELSKSTTLTDPAYWLQTLFSAGIAVLGLVLNSPAVIIGAMLISPLMGPILAGGLALATGDVVLGLRSALNLLLSCILAIGFAFLIVVLLPFKEITAEIASRTHPNTLDLAVAFFSGAIGSIAICKEVKGVVTSIPGVAIAVALMPPLGVIGYGIAVAVSLSTQDGMSVALGGGLLFLTNLVAITFTAMIIFLALHIDVPVVKEQMEDWHKIDAESIRLRNMFSRLPLMAGVRHIGTLPGRMMMILIVMLVILIPLSRSFNELKSELDEQQRQNRVRQLVAQTWQQEFGKLENGETRSFLDQASISERLDKLILQLRVLTSKPLSSGEKEQFNRLVEASLGRPKGSVETQIVEVPTAAAALRPRVPSVQAPAPLSLTQLQADLFDRIDRALTGIYLPPPAKLIDYQLSAGPSNRLDLTLSYLSEREIEPDAQAVIQQDVRNRLELPQARARLVRVPVLVGQVSFRGRDATLNVGSDTLDQAAIYLREHPKLRLEISVNSSQNSSDTNSEIRLAAIKTYLTSQKQIADERILVEERTDSSEPWPVRLVLPE